ncbi:MAG: helix-turn-helix domain-containing protein [Raineya sp.]|nr:helix-turn-helix domain-containing protein [Raineya sp.]
MENIGKKLQIVRELHNFTQEYVASKLGITQAAYAKVEQKQSIPKDLLDKIAKEIYGVDSEKILNLPTDPKIIIQNIFDNNGVIINISGNISFNKANPKEIEEIKRDFEELKIKLEKIISRII